MKLANSVNVCDSRERLGPVPAGFPDDLFDDRISCCLCAAEGVPPDQAAGFSLLCEINGAHAFAGRKFSLYRCDKCGIGITFPRVAARYTPLLYENQNALPFFNDEGAVNWLRQIFFRQEARWWIKWLDKTKGLLRNGVWKVLDFGTGNGMNATAFASILGRRGKVWATDFSRQPPAYISKNVKVTYLAQESLEGTGQTYDCVHLRHILEHDADPLAFLLRMRGLLCAGGSLLIEVPSLLPVLRSFDLCYLPELFQAGLPYHYYFFTQESLSALLARAGFSSELCMMDMPVVGRMLQARTGHVFAGKRYFVLFVLGVILYPLQWLYVRLKRAQPMIRVLARNKL